MRAVDYMSETDQKFRQKLLVNMVNIGREMAEHPVRMMDIGYMVAEAEDNYDRAKSNFEKTQLILSRQVREKCKISKTKLTESQITERIVVHSDYEKSHSQFLDAKKLLNQVKSKYRAMADKGEMLRAVAQIKKKEIQA